MVVLSAPVVDSWVGWWQVGAGLVAMPVRTVSAGFGPTAVALVGSWAYMVGAPAFGFQVNCNDPFETPVVEL